MSVQSDLLKTLGGAVAVASGIAGADKDEDALDKAEEEAGALAIRGQKREEAPEAEKEPKRAKPSKLEELKEANRKATEELAAAQEQKIQLQKRIKVIGGRYGGKMAAKNREIARLKGEAE